MATTTSNGFRRTHSGKEDLGITTSRTASPGILDCIEELPFADKVDYDFIYQRLKRSVIATQGCRCSPVFQASTSSNVSPDAPYDWTTPDAPVAIAAKTS